MVAIPEEVGPRPLIPEFYSGRSVLITGATGFMGKVLVERLLATCPDIGRLFLLVRSKRDVSPEKRLLELKNGQAFAVIQQSCPRQLDKLQLVPGDISSPGLGLSINSIAQLDEVSLIFNCAATVRFEEPLKVAVEQNVLSVTRLCELADRLPNVAAFIHVSTAYCNPELPKIEEKVYPLPKPLHVMIEEGLAVPNDTPVDELKRMIHPKPNTYTFTKMMAETAARQHGRRYPLAIFRPSIVISALRHPFPGWVENYNGPIGIMVAISHGLLHVFRIKSSARADMLPVDLAIDTLIAVGWETAIDNLPTVRVYNCCTGENPTTWEDMRYNVVEESRRQPLLNVTWYPTCLFTNCGFLHYTLTFLLQTAPLHLAEYLIRLFSHKKNRLSLIRADSRLRTMHRVLEYFAIKQWEFVTDNVRLLRERLSHQDALIYNLDPFTIHWKSHYKNCVRGCRLYLVGDKEENLPEAKNRLSKKYVIHRSLTILLPLLVLWWYAAPAQKLAIALISVLSNLPSSPFAF